MDEPIEMLLGAQIRVGPKNHVLDRDPDPPTGGALKEVCTWKPLDSGRVQSGP